MTQRMTSQICDWYARCSPCHLQECVNATLGTRETPHELETWSTVNVLKKGRKVADLHQTDLAAYNLLNRYPILKENKANLLAMLPYLQLKYHNFYKNL